MTQNKRYCLAKLLFYSQFKDRTRVSKWDLHSNFAFNSQQMEIQKQTNIQPIGVKDPLI